MSLSRAALELDAILELYSEIRRADDSYFVAKKFQYANESYRKEYRDQLLNYLVGKITSSSHPAVIAMGAMVQEAVTKETSEEEGIQTLIKGLAMLKLEVESKTQESKLSQAEAPFTEEKPMVSTQPTSAVASTPSKEVKPVSRKYPLTDADFAPPAWKKNLERRSIFVNSSRASVQTHSDYLLLFSKSRASQQRVAVTDSAEQIKENNCLRK